MNFRLRTLFVVLLIAAMAIGWHSGRVRFAESRDSWANEKLELQTIFDATLSDMSDGASVLSRVFLARDILKKIEQRIGFLGSPINEAKQITKEIATGELVHMWRNKDNLKLLTDKIISEDPTLRDYDWMLDLGSDLWVRGQFTDAKEFFELAKSQAFTGRDLESEEFDSLRAQIGRFSKTQKTKE